MKPNHRWGVALMLVALAAEAQIAKLELYPLPSTTPSDAQFLSGARDAPAVTLGAELRIPRPGSDRLPAVVLLHGSPGISDREDQWAREFAAIGVATLLVDSFSARGIASTVADQDQLSRLAMVGDAYRALDLLARHSRIDTSRVALMGFSRGGGAAHWAALKRFQRLYGTPGLEFAAYIAFYPTCNRRFGDGLDVSERPIRLFHGTADDYIPIAGCRAYVDELARAGKDITLTAYEGAHHGFDNAARRQPIKVAQAQTTRACPLVVEDTERRLLVNAVTRAPFVYGREPCVERGTTLAYDAAAHEASRAAVRELIGALPGPGPR